MAHLNEGTVPIVTTGASAASASIAASGLVVTVTRGPDTGATTTIHDVAHRRVLVGQSAACDIRLGDRSVSRRHLSIEVEANKLRIVDLGSRNGTLASGVEVKEVCIRPGTEITLGHTTLRLDLDGVSHVIAASSAQRWNRVVGASAAMRRLYPVFDRLVGGGTHVLIEGEAGTGKELLAESIHDAGRADAGIDVPFVVFEPASSPAHRIEVDLFGEGATPGLIEAASGGSLFIDEVGDLPINVQAKLLRVLERQETRRADAAAQAMPIRVRVFASTRRNLDADVQERRFKDDLHIALSVARVDLPPLRKRGGDIAFLAQHFWTALGGRAEELPASVVQRWDEHDWPGNVRELVSAVSRLRASGEAALPTGPASRGRDTGFVDVLLARDLPLPLAREEMIAEFERLYMDRMLAIHGGHIGRAASASGIGRRYFQKLRAKK